MRNVSYLIPIPDEKPKKERVVLPMYKMDMQKRGISVVSADQIISLEWMDEEKAIIDEWVFTDRMWGKFMTKCMDERALEQMMFEFPDDMKQYNLMMEIKLEKYFTKHKVNRFNFSDDYPAWYDRLYLSTIAAGHNPRFIKVKIVWWGELTRFVTLWSTAIAMKTFQPVWNVARYKWTIIERFDEGVVVPYWEVDCPFRDGEYIIKWPEMCIDDVMEAIFHEGVEYHWLTKMAKKWFVQRIRDRLWLSELNVTQSAEARRISWVDAHTMEIEKKEEPSSRDKLYCNFSTGQVSYKDGLEFKIK